nr:hypothetical protein [Pandoravirus aubagnensis]
MCDQRQRAAIDEAARTGRLPFANDAVAAREDAHDRAIVRREMAKLVVRMRAMDGHGLPPSDPLGPPGNRASVPPTLQMHVHWGRSAFLCASLLPDGSGWSVYRCDPKTPVKPHHVGLVGMPWCDHCRGVPSGCAACTPYAGATEPPAPTDSASADPWRWPIGVAWTWTHDQMEDHQLALRRAACFSYSTVSTSRRVRRTDAGVAVSFCAYQGGGDNKIEYYRLHSLMDLWASRLACTLTGHCPYRNSTEQRHDNVDGVDCEPLTPIDAHACVVGLAEARAAVDRLAFSVRAYSHDMNWGRDTCESGARCAWSLLCGWIAAVEALLRNEAFYLTHVAPYEVSLLEAASGGLISAAADLDERQRDRSS